MKRQVDVWQNINSQELGDYKIFKVRCDRNQSIKTGKTFEFYVIDSSDWVSVVPITTVGQIVMVKQFRQARRQMGLEVPAGIIDITDKNKVEAIKRELLEETGYTCETIIPLGVVNPNPAIMSNQLHIFVALNVEKMAEQQLDDSEEISIEIVDLDDVPQLIQQGYINNALSIVAFYLLHAYLNDKS